MRSGSVRNMGIGACLLALMFALLAALAVPSLALADGSGDPEPPHGPDPPDTTVTSAPDEPEPLKQESDATLTKGVPLPEILELLVLITKF